MIAILYVPSLLEDGRGLPKIFAEVNEPIGSLSVNCMERAANLAWAPVFAA